MSTEGEASAAELPDKKEISLAAKRKKRGQSKQKAPNEDSDSVPGRSSSSSSRRKRIASIRGAANVATEDSDFDPAEERPKKAAKRRKTKKGGKSNYLCSHCEKSFTSEGGLKYHVDNHVCRMDEVKAQGNKRRRAKNKGGSTPPNKRFRGKLENRTCPHCKRVFTSTLGMNYHVSRKVCQQPAKNSAALLPTLQPGDRFVTSFGLVEVVKDDRATPTAMANDISKEQQRYYQSAKSKVEKQRSKMFLSKSIRFRARRAQVNTLYDKENVNQASVFHAYFGGDPSSVNENKKLPPMPKPLQDPTAPQDSFPDRIVDCIWLQEDESGQRKTAQHLFLQRRLLTEPYVEDGGAQVCSDCGQRFLSAPGYKYHTSNKVCVQKKMKNAEARQAQKKQVDIGATRILNGGHVPPEYTVGGEKPNFTKRTGDKRKRPKKKKETAMYPEVLMSLGFKVIRENMSFTDNMLLPSVIPSKYDDAAEIDLKNDLTVDPPDALLNHLKQTLVEKQRVSDDQKYGSMYAEVHKALGYQKPRRQKTVGCVNRRRRAAVVKPAPPIIDVSALADEIDSGRYPSKRRYTGDDHADICFICKDGGTLLCCDFCPKSVHMHCISEKFTLKAPEPDEDFMCHKCIQMILQRRKRAQGRRYKKHEREELERKAEEKRNPDIKTGMEYEHLASKGQDFSELVELLHDARLRLKQSLATSKMNDLRRRIMSHD